MDGTLPKLNNSLPFIAIHQLGSVSEDGEAVLQSNLAASTNNEDFRFLVCNTISRIPRKRWQELNHMRSFIPLKRWQEKKKGKSAIEAVKILYFLAENVVGNSVVKGAPEAHQAPALAPGVAPGEQGTRHGRVALVPFKAPCI